MLAAEDAGVLGAGRGAGRASGNGQGGKTAKDWQVLQEQEDRLAMITERRDYLMDLDRKKNQEAFLAEKRKVAADQQSQTQDIR